MVRKLIVFLCCAGLFLVALPRPVTATCGTPTPTLTFTPTPTPTSTPDANGYIPPSPIPTATFTPTPTEPVGTKVAAMAGHAQVIAEGQVIFPEATRAGFYYAGYNEVHFAVDRYYQGNGATILKFNYFLDPCSYGIPPFIANQSGIFFFGSSQPGRYDYRAQLPADDDIRQSLALAVGPGEQPREVYATGIPLAAAFLGIGLVVWTMILWRLMLRR